MFLSWKKKTVIKEQVFKYICSKKGLKCDHIFILFIGKNCLQYIGKKKTSKGRVTHNDILKIFCKYTEVLNFKNI